MLWCREPTLSVPVLRAAGLQAPQSRALPFPLASEPTVPASRMIPISRARLCQSLRRLLIGFV